MKGATKKRGTHGLRKRCPECKKLRKFCEPDMSTTGENHPRRPPWGKVEGRWVCGFCLDRDFQPLVERKCLTSHTNTA